MPPSSEVVATLAVEIEPTLIAVAPDGRRAYVTMFESGGPDEPDRGAVAVIDTANDAVVAAVPAGRAVGIAVAPDSRHVYVLQWLAGAVLRVLDAQTHAVVEDIKLGRGLPEGLALTRDGHELYAIIGNDDDINRGTVQVIDTASRKIVATLAGSPFPGRAAATPDGRFIFVLDTEDTPTKIDTATHETTFATDVGGERIAFGPDGTLYECTRNNFEATGLDFTTGKPVAVFAANRRLRDLAVTPDGRLLCATLSAENPVVMFEIGSFTPPAHRVSYPGEADAIAIMPDSRSAFIANRGKRTVQRITLDAG